MIQPGIDKKTARIAQLRNEKDLLFKTSPSSPLSQGQRLRFGGLNYFPYDPALDLHVEIVPFPERQDVQLATSSGESRWFRRYGEFHYEMDCETVRLTVYQSATGFFLPFVDAGAGDVTYPAGRYIEPVQLGDGAFHIDFNQAYNPFCAYGENWSCPITPPENHLRLKVEAGEKLPTGI